jgi:tripartite-type tricarboxylate transporter receptor subunit TctC
MTVFHRRYAPEAIGRRSAAMMSNFRRVAVAASLLASTFAQARGETRYPDHAVRVIVPFALPTLAEQGFPGQEAETLLFVLAPAGTPPDIVNALSTEFRKIVASPEIQSQFDTLGFSPLATTPEDSEQRIKDEVARWAKVIKDANIQAGD